MILFFFFNDTATTEIYTLSLHDALPIYKSYHLLVNVPIYLQNGIENIKVEVQIRTIAMDMWASLEHKLCYHKEVDTHTKLELRRLANVVSFIDNNMEEMIGKSRELVALKKKQKVRVK